MFLLWQRRSFLAIALLTSSLSPCFSAVADETPRRSLSRSSTNYSLSSSGMSSAEEAADEIRKKYPAFFKGENNRYMPKEEQQAFFTLFETQAKDPKNASQPNLVESKPYEFLILYAQALGKYVGTLDFKGKEIIIEDLERYIARNEVSADKLLMVVLRIQAAQTVLTPDETDLYQHLLNPAEALVTGVMKDEAWRSDMQTAQQIAEYTCFPKNKNAYDDYHPIGALASEVYDDLRTKLNQALPSRLYFPLPGESYLGIHYLLDCLFDDHFPISMPTPGQSKKAHGADMSPLGFTIHDYLHYLIDSRRRSLLGYAITLLDKAASEGVDYEAAIPLSVKQAVGHYKLIMTTFKSLLLALDQRAIDEKSPLSEKQYRQSLSGLFWLFHETETLPEGCFKKETLHELVLQMTENAKARLRANECWESDFDLFETSPVDGTTALSDDAIAEKVLDNLDAVKAFLTHPACTKVTKADIKKTEVKKSPRFVDVIVTFKNGESRHYSFPTLYHKYENAKDNLKLLQWAHTGLEFEALPADVTAARETALASINQVTTALANNIDFFVKTSGGLFEDMGEGLIPLRVRFASGHAAAQPPQEDLPSRSLKL